MARVVGKSITPIRAAQPMSALTEAYRIAGGVTTANLTKDADGDFMASTMPIAQLERPANYWYRWTERYNFSSQYAVMDFYATEVSILSTIKHRMSAELLRYGVELVPKFKKKCQDCDHEWQENLTTCPNCKGKRLRKPDLSQERYFLRPNGKSFLQEANDNNQSMKDVFKAYAEMQIIYNQAGIVRVSDDILDPKDLSVEKSYTSEFIPQDPKFMRMLYDETGKMGDKYGFIMTERTTRIPLDDTNSDGYTKQGHAIYPAYWSVGENYGADLGGQYQLYTKDELYADHWFGQSLTYGRPIWLDIEDDLLTWHYMEKHMLKKYAYGYVRGMLVLPGFNEDQVKNVAKGIKNTLSKNDNSIPIVGIPKQPPGTPRLEAQFVTFGSDADNFIPVKDDIRRRLCGHIGIPDLLVTDTESSGGMNNESQQLTVFDRYLMNLYEYLDRLGDWVLSWFPMITDLELRVIRPTKADMETNKLLQKIQVAQGLSGLGFPPISFIDGEFTFPQYPAGQGPEDEVAPMPEDTDMDMGGGGGEAPPMNEEQSDDAQFETGEDANAITDIETDESEEFDSELDKSTHIRKDCPCCSLDEGEMLKKNDKTYLKALSEEGWNKLLVKDSYGFLRNNRDDIIQVLTAGREISYHFKTCTREQVKEIYAGMIEVIQEPKWSVKQLDDAIRNANPSLTDDQIYRIRQTELGRITSYAKEQSSIRSQDVDALYSWTGPLDDRTTPMCRFLQTGELSGSYRYGGSFNFEALRPELPEWKEEGWTLPDLKEVIRKTWAVFYNVGVITTDLVGDWIIHIGCRHTFQARSRIAREGARGETLVMNDYIIDPDDVVPMLVEMSGSEEHYTIPADIPEGLAFASSMYPQPTYFEPTEEDDYPTFVFTSMTEQEVAEWSRLVYDLLETEDPMTIVWLLQDELPYASDDEIDFIMANNHWLYDMGIEAGWLDA